MGSMNGQEAVDFFVGLDGVRITSMLMVVFLCTTHVLPHFFVVY